MRKLMKLMSLLAFAVATQYSCINDADVITPDSIDSNSDGNLALFFEIPNVLQNARSAESSGENETGSPEEYAVNSVTLYLFDANTKAFVYSFDLENIQLVSQSGQQIQYTANRINIKPGKYNIFAIANGKAATSNIGSQEKFLEAVDALTYKGGKIPSAPKNGFVMSNRGNANLNIEVSKSPEDNKVTTVSIGLERVVAKIEVTQKGETFPLYDDKGKEYAKIKINNFRMLNLATEFYTFRHTAVLNSLTKPNGYTDENFGNINDNNGYVIDPYFFNKTIENAHNFTNPDGFYAQALVQLDPNDANWAGMSPAGSWSRIYCLENCMFKSTQFNAFTTGFMFKANIDIATDRVFDKDKQPVSDPSSWGEEIYYFTYNFYTSIEAVRVNAKNDLPSNITDKSSAEELAIYNIKRFTKAENYSCYYNYWIKHQDNNLESEMGVMEFGIVRNNIYRISISKVAGLGTGEPYIDPENPDEPKALLEANLDVFPWAVRRQDDAVLE